MHIYWDTSAHILGYYMARQVSQVSPYLSALSDAPCLPQLARCRYQLPSLLHLPPLHWNCTNLTLNLQTFSSSRLCKLFSNTNSSISRAHCHQSQSGRAALGRRSLTVVTADRCDLPISISWPLHWWLPKNCTGACPRRPSLESDP